MSELFEITSIAAKEQYIVMLNDANDEPLKDKAGGQLSVTVFGPGSKAYAKATAARTQRMMDRMAKKGKSKLTAEEQIKETAEFLAAITIGFNGWVYKGGADAASILAAYKDSEIGFITDQIQKAAGDWANFSASAVTN